MPTILMTGSFMYRNAHQRNKSDVSSATSPVWPSAFCRLPSIPCRQNHVSANLRCDKPSSVSLYREKFTRSFPQRRHCKSKITNHRAAATWQAGVFAASRSPSTETSLETMLITPRNLVSCNEHHWGWGGVCCGAKRLSESQDEII